MINWNNIYNSLILKGKQRALVEGVYYEKHHILPRYLGGDNSKLNLVYLEFREHILAHYILWRCYNNIEDKIAYKMMSGQTEEGRILKQILAVSKSNESNKVKKIKELFQDKDKVKSIIEKRKNTRYKNYDGWYDDKALLSKSKKAKENYTKMHNKESLKKRSKSLKKFINEMSKEKFYDRYIKPMEGPLHPMYGKKRPGELAGNYGKTKGQYILTTPIKEEIIFNGIKDLIKYGMNELTIRKWSNKGVIQKDPKCYKPFKWEGYELKFIENLNYGEVNSKEKTKPNQKSNNK
jgi:hypothetical protein